MGAVWVVLAVLATYRLARMMALEDGPADVFSRVRERVGQASWVGRGLHCTLCISFWWAWLVTLLLPLSSVSEYVLVSLGVAGGAVAVGKFFG